MKIATKSGNGSPRHAQVVPAFVVAGLTRPLDSWVGKILPAELLRWERLGDLSDSARRDLRKTILKRMRVRAERLWSEQIGVHLAQGWQESLGGQDRRRLEALPLTEGKPLEAWTLRELKDELRIPLEHVFEILARLESVYWEPPPVSLLGKVTSSPEYQPPVEVTTEVKAQAQEVLGFSWLSAVQPNDVRFGFDNADSLPAWIRSHCESKFAPSRLQELLVDLLRADKMTAEAEAHELARRVAHECAPRSGGPEAANRWASILMRRHISRVGPGRTLAEVGVEFGVTRERIRQVCEAFEEALSDAEIATPALDRVLLAAARVAPSTVDELDEQFRRFIGEGAGIEALVAWAKLLNRDTLPVECEQVRTRVRGKLVEVTMVQAPNAPSWVEALIRHVSRDISMFGCTNVLRVAGRLALKESVAPGQEAIETALEAAAGFRWLSKQTGWFTLGDTSNCSVATRVRKIVAVAQESVGTDEIAGALASDDMLMYRESVSLGLATPPVHVLRELFLCWPWLQVVQKGRFTASPAFDPSGVLSDVEQTIVNVITQHDGIACRFELKEVVIGQLGLTDVLLAVTLGSSPIIERVEHGLYRLRGRRVGDGALGAARMRLRERAYPMGGPYPNAGNDVFFARVTEASIRHEQYYVPTRFLKALSGNLLKVISPDGSIGEARVNRSGVLAGINRLFPEVKPGDLYRIEVRATSLSLEVQKIEAAQMLSESSDGLPLTKKDLGACPDYSGPVGAANLKAKPTRLVAG